MFKREETRRLNATADRFKSDPLFFTKGRLNKALIITVLILLLAGLIFLFSASLLKSFSEQGNAYYYIKKQLLGLTLGLLSLIILSRINYRFFKKFSLSFLIISILFLIAVFIPGIGAQYGTSHSWLNIFGMSFQVAELVKLFFIFYLAAWVESRQDDLKNFSTGLLPFLLVVSLLGFLFIIQPDFGGFFLVFLIALSIYFVAGGNVRQLLVLFLIFVFIALLFWPRINDPEASGFFRSYQLDRFRCLNNPNYDRDACYQVNQSLIAVGSGGLWGRGFSNSVQKFNYLPEVWADSIFPIIAEEIGFIGSVVLILAYVFLLYQGLMIAKRAPDVYGRSLAVGISAWIFFQVFLNIAGMINLVPMTGVPLPFISAGGSSLWFLLASIGILLNIDRQSLKSN